MKSHGFRRFVAVFVGVLLVLAAVFAAVTQEESLIGTTLLVAVLYTIYMVQFVRKEKELSEKKPKAKESPLLRR